MMTPEQKSLLDDFTSESKDIISTLQILIEELETGIQEPTEFAHFAQRIDGIMGCAKTLGIDGLPGIEIPLAAVGNLSEGCKSVGYKASQIKDPGLSRLVASFFAEALELLDEAIDDLKNGTAQVDPAQAIKIRDRINWIGSQMKLSSQDQAEILARFGLK
jgi:hypothetical protein